MYNKYDTENRIPDYEIISFGNEVLKLKKESQKYFSGVIKCTLKNITPMFIGGKKNVIKIKGGGKHNENYFPENEKEKQYVIPASSLKGMIRAMTDMLTDSVVVESKVNKNEPEYKGKLPFLNNFIDKKFHPTNDNNNLSIGENIFGATENSEVEKKGKFKNIQGKLYFTD